MSVLEAMQARKAERVLIREELGRLRHDMQTNTEQTARLAGQLVNDTLEVFSGAFDTSLQFSRQYKVAIGSVEVTNLSTTAGQNIVVSSDAPSPSGSTPTGTGTYVVPPGATRTVAIAGRRVTLYGAAAAQGFNLQAFTAGVRPVTT